MIKAKYVANTNIADKGPWVGFMRFLGLHLPVFGFMKSVVLYPPMYHRTLYSELGEFNQSINPSDICGVRFTDKTRYDKHLIVFVEDKAVIAPDWTNNGVQHIDAIQFIYEGNTVCRLRSVGPEECEILQNDPSCRKTATVLRSHNETDGLPRG